MKCKRPAILFLASLILGIIIANALVPIFIKLILVCIAIFLYGKMFWDEKLSLRVILVIFAFLLIGFFRFKLEERTFDNLTDNVENLGKGSKEITGIIDQIGKSTNSNYFVLVSCESSGLKLGKCRCYFSSGGKNAKIGNSVKVLASTTVIEAPMNEGEFNQLNYYRSEGITFTAFAKEIEIVSEKYDYVKQKIYEIKLLIKAQVSKIFNEKDAGLFTAMITGDKSTIDKIQKKLFSDNGIAHILAISGLHLSILGLALFEFLRKKFSVKVSAFVVSLFILFYGIFIDAGATSLRAIIMLYARFLSLCIGRTYDSKNALYLTCFAFLLYRPYLLFNAGFQFSYVAIYALNEDVTIYIKNRSYKVPAVITLTLFLFPITIYHYFTYPLYSIFLNLIVIPLMSFVLGFGIFALLISFICLPLGNIVALVVHFIFLFYEKLCYLIDSLPGHILWLGKPALYEVIYFYVALFIIIWAFSSKDKNEVNVKDKTVKTSYGLRVLVSAVLLFMSIGIIGIRKQNDLRITFLSVGQGDSMIVEAKGTILSIDGGSTSNTSNGQYVITPHIKSRAINHIDYAFISHPDQDHINGISYMMENEDELKIKNLVVPTLAKESTKWQKLLNIASSSNINIKYMDAGDIATIKDDLTITVVSPMKDDVETKKIDVNDLSLAFRLDYNNHSALFTGDMGKTTIQRLLDNDEPIDVDVLKVPHHGSKNSLVDGFFEKVSPTYSVISYGKNNMYGHPHEVTVDALKDAGSLILKTAETGQIDFYFDKAKIEYVE